MIDRVHISRDHWSDHKAIGYPEASFRIEVVRGSDYDALAAELAEANKQNDDHWSWRERLGQEVERDLARISALETALSDGLNIARCAPTSGDLAQEWRSYMNAWGDRVTSLLPQLKRKGDANASSDS